MYLWPGLGHLGNRMIYSWYESNLPGRRVNGVVWEPSRLVVVGDRKLEDSHTRDVTRTSHRGVGKARHRCDCSRCRGDEKRRAKAELQKRRVYNR